MVKREGEHDYVKLARETVEKYARTKKKVDPPAVDNCTAKYDKKAGVFVSIKKRGQLRGCIGTIEAVQNNLAEEIINNAVSAAFHDPRFPPVKRDELDELDYSVDVLGKAEIVENKEELNPEKYGVIVEKGLKRGLLLPNLEGVDTVDKQLSIARRKAGIIRDIDYQIFRFEVKRFR